MVVATVVMVMGGGSEGDGSDNCGISERSGGGSDSGSGVNEGSDCGSSEQVFNVLVVVKDMINVVVKVVVVFTVVVIVNVT